MSSELVIYHNPRCSKSRASLQLLRDQGLEPRVVEYLKTPLGENEILRLLDQLEMDASDLVRRGEAAFGELGLDPDSASPETWMAALVEHPALLQRPIISNGQQAVIGRPPENVLKLL